jgi:hypothetical protein
MGLDDTAACLRRAGVQARVPESGCCGMAGAFGFEGGEHYEVSLRCGERVLLPEVRAAGDETMIVADGFSCREQIAQGTDRFALHVADVLHLALQGTALRGRAEAGQLAERSRAETRARQRAALAASGLLAGGLAVGLAVRYARAAD